ncbi:dicarboxylate/amino acid:cation symporter [Corynebacterium macginleyi]|uniref:dicarboxylate/amino acid:cation symporter n=1 Tax=Corynebacterium macginleyi TaxID=38290 RepID=UPI0019093341|nr:dicarboxylate/amino acid:cation symporter [Corynebacterium macginleyi]MBK4138684.1 cation:dicarboxylase symporter family transporter [Corynebacterium macginleyi]MBK4147481.1 cation:dicarboxylase symporter family transporter [Corynebacterium macginleyi]MBK4158221.1 cation:dicarboxylase symporter family transporter [Corynebacterium macginleyi]MBK4177366.1 cation:dicarboxylase symporter family transporter [Corynebacterium macginleyi]
MNLKKIADSLLVRIVIAIVLGIVVSLFAPEWFGRAFATFNGLFGNFLNFFIPVLIFALVAPAIAGLGKGAGKWLGFTAGVAYGSTVLAGLIAYGLAKWLYPWMLAGQTLVTNVSDVDEGSLSPYFEVKMAPPFEVMTALLLSFCIGVAMTMVKSDTLYTVTKELENVVVKVIWGFVIPILPFYIFGMFLGLGMNGNIGDVLSAFAKVLILAVVMTLVYLVLQYVVAGAITGKNPFKALRNMLPAYFTALGTSSSAATIPVSLESSLRNGISKPVASFVIPLCATIHLSGSMMKLTLYAFAIIFMANMDISTGTGLGFVFLLGIMMIAAPGVPGGAVMVAVGLLADMMGFDDGMVALMIAAYIAIDSVGTAANVTGDGAIAMVVDKFARDKVDTLNEEEVGTAA